MFKEFFFLAVYLFIGAWCVYYYKQYQLLSTNEEIRIILFWPVSTLCCIFGAIYGFYIRGRRFFLARKWNRKGK